MCVWVCPFVCVCVHPPTPITASISLSPFLARVSGLCISLPIPPPFCVSLGICSRPPRAPPPSPCAFRHAGYNFGFIELSYAHDALPSVMASACDIDGVEQVFSCSLSFLPPCPVPYTCPLRLHARLLSTSRSQEASAAYPRSSREGTRGDTFIYSKCPLILLLPLSSLSLSTISVFSPTPLLFICCR